MYPGYEGSLASTSNQYAIRVTRAGTLRNLYVMQNNPGTGTATITYTVVVAGVDSALTVGILPTATTAQNTTDSVSVSAGDQIVIKLTKSANVGAVSQITVTVEFV
jgi:hypothetical protein